MPKLIVKHLQWSSGYLLSILFVLVANIAANSTISDFPCIGSCEQEVDQRSGPQIPVDEQTPAHLSQFSSSQAEQVAPMDSRPSSRSSNHLNSKIPSNQMLNKVFQANLEEAAELQRLKQEVMQAAMNRSVDLGRNTTESRSQLIEEYVLTIAGEIGLDIQLASMISEALVESSAKRELIVRRLLEGEYDDHEFETMLAQAKSLSRTSVIKVYLDEDKRRLFDRLIFRQQARLVNKSVDSRAVLFANGLEPEIKKHVSDEIKSIYKKQLEQSDTSALQSITDTVADLRALELELSGSLGDVQLRIAQNWIKYEISKSVTDPI